MIENKKEIEENVNYLKYYVILGLIVFLVLASGYYFYLNINVRVGEVREQRAHLEALNNRDKNYARLQSDFEKIEQKYQLINNALPGQENFIAFIIDLERQAIKSDVEIEIVFAQDPQVQNSQLSFTIEISGQINNVLKYLTEIKKQSYYIQIDSLNLSKITAKNQFSGEIIIKVGVDETFQPSQISG